MLATIRASDTAEWERGQNRVKINNAANCAPPLDAEVAKKIGLKVNVNWGELMELLAQARRQYRTAFFSNLNFFRVQIPKAPPEHQSEWGEFITDAINKPLRDSRDYFELHESRWSAVVCHGMGPMVWYEEDKWLPDFVAIEDFRIPTDTILSFKNLDWWGIRHMYTPGELVEKAFAPNSQWKKKAVGDILKNYKNINYDYAPNAYDWETTPEKFAELFRQDGGWFASDAMPVIPLWHFYFEDKTIKGEEGIYMCIVPDTGAIRGTPPNDFLWRSEKPIAKKREHVIHCQFGDLSAKAPPTYQGLRSLGFALMEPTFYSNLTLCRGVQHLMDNFNIWLRSNDPADKARAQVQEFGNLSVVKPGLAVIPQTERHQVDSRLMESIIAKMKQLQQEASSAYTQSTDTGTRREQTAFETRVKVEQVNAMMSGLLIKAFKYESYAYKEICRRFCLDKTEDEDILVFQKACADFGIDRKWLNVALWEVEPITPLGMGNPTIAAAQAQQLMQARGAYAPEAQQEILHEFTLEATKDPRKAARWAPIGKRKGPEDAQKFAEADFNILMRGIPAQIMQGSNPIGQIETMLPLLAGEISNLTNTGGMATQREINGLKTVEQHIQQLIAMVSSDEANKERVKTYADTLGKLMNEVKAFEQRLAEQQKKAAAQNGNGGLTPDIEAKIHAIMATSAAKVHATQMKDQAKQKQNSEKFVREERRKDASAFAEIQRQGVKAKADAATRMKGFDE